MKRKCACKGQLKAVHTHYCCTTTHTLLPAIQVCKSSERCKGGNTLKQVTQKPFCITTIITFADEGQKDHDSLATLICFSKTGTKRANFCQATKKCRRRDFLLSFFREDSCFLKVENNAIINSEMQLGKKGIMSRSLQF